MAGHARQGEIMVRQEMFRGRPLYVCEQCGFGYYEKELAMKCEEFCKSMGACSPEITKYAARKPMV